MLRALCLLALTRDHLSTFHLFLCLETKKVESSTFQIQNELEILSVSKSLRVGKLAPENLCNAEFAKHVTKPAPAHFFPLFHFSNLKKTNDNLDLRHTPTLVSKHKFRFTSFYNSKFVLLQEAFRFDSYKVPLSNGYPVPSFDSLRSLKSFNLSPTLFRL